ncbi:MAG: hypothetical protein AAB316_03830 [Bacteroidota bacterium]|mgnify:CR=1 FL=1
MADLAESGGWRYLVQLFHAKTTTMKAIFTALLFCLTSLATTLAAQVKDYDLVLLKTGDSYIGDIIHYEQGGVLVLRQKDGVEIEVRDEDIRKVFQAAPVRKVKAAEFKTQVKTQKPAVKPRMIGVYNSTYLAFAFGGSENDLALGAGLHNVFGKQWKPWFGTGIGVGIDSYARRGETIFPAFLEIRSFLPSKKPTGGYYLTLSGGYGFAFTRKKLDITEAEGGWMSHAALGYRTATADGTDVYVDLGVKFQKAEFARSLSNGDTEYKDVLYRRLTFRVGLTLWK